MTKKFLTVFLFLMTPIFGGCDDLSCNKWLVDANVGYFYPFSETLRETVSGGADYQLMLTYKVNKPLGFFAAGDFFYKRGYSTGDHARTTFWLLPITLGLRATADLWSSCNQSKTIQGYFLIGPRWYFAHANNSANYVDGHNQAQGFGGMAGVGLSYLINNFTINAFVNASVGTVCAQTDKQNVLTPEREVGGFVAGGGIGWNF